MAKDEIVRIANGAAESAAVNSNKSADALLLKKKLADDAANKAEARKDQPADEQVAAEEGKEEAAPAVEVAAADGAASDASPAMLAGVSDSFLSAAAQTGASSNGISNTTLLVGGGVLLAGGAIAIASNNDDDGGGKSSSPDTVVSGAASVNEGGTATFTVTGKPGSTFDYVLSGVQAADIQDGKLSGTVTIGDDGKGYITVNTLADTLTEGPETLKVTVGGKEATTTVTDTSLSFPVTVEAESATVAEGTQAIFRLTGAPGATASFALSGTAVGADYTVNPAGGQVTFDSEGKATVIVTTINDNVNEVGGETLTLTIGTVSDTVTINDVAADTYVLTSKVEEASANKFISRPDYTPGGDDLVNTLQNEDILHGTGANASLDAIIGGVNDNSEYIVAPVLDKIATATFQFTAGNSPNTVVDFQNATGLTSLAVTRIVNGVGDVGLTSLQDETVNLALSNATRQTNTIEFNYAEGQLEENNNVVNLALNNVRVSQLLITQGDAGDTSEDEGFSAETFNVTIGGTGPTNIDHFYLAPNVEEEETDGTTQTVNFVVNKNLEVNDLIANGAETVDIKVNSANFLAAADEDLVLGLTPNTNEANDGWSTGDLHLLTISGTGNVTIDGLNGDVITGNDPFEGTPGPLEDGFGDDEGVEVAAATLNGNLWLGINKDTAGDDLLKVTSGAGKDWIASYGTLGGDIFTNAGDDKVEVRSTDFIIDNPLYDPGADLDNVGIDDQQFIFETDAGDARGTVTIDTGIGNDSVWVAGDLLAHVKNDYTNPDDLDEIDNQNFDDVEAAKILTGDGNDSVSVGALHSARDGDNFQLNDTNLDDLYFVVGALIDTGAGDDTVESFELAEAATITTGTGNDAVTINVDAGVVLGADDTNPQEVNKDKTINTLGAIVDLGDGNDSVLFTDEGLDIDGKGPDLGNYLLVGEGAEVRGGPGTNVFTVETVDEVDVVAHSVTDGFTNKLITGFQTANFTVLNAIGQDTADNTAAKGDQNDNGGGFWGPTGIIADIGRFDEALTTINLTSEEQPLLLLPEFENYEESNDGVYFELDNLRSGIAVNLIAHESNVDDIIGDTEPSVPGDVGDPADDFETILDFAAADVVGARGILENPFVSENDDVRLDVNYDVANASGNADTFTLNVLPVPAGSTDGGEFDLELFLGRTEFDDLFDPAASTTDDDDLLIENLVINLTDSASHLIDLNGFGDYGDNVPGHTDTYSEGSLVVETSVTINGTKDGTHIDVVNTNADTIKILGAADVFLQLDRGAPGSDALTPYGYENNYDIETGSGDDIIDMRGDTVRANDGVDDALDSPNVVADAVAGDAVDEADIVEGGAGRNVLIVDGANSLGTINGVDPDDDVFENLFNLQTILVESGDFGTGTAQEIVLDEAAFENTKVDSLLFTGEGDQTTEILIGDDFEVGAGAPVPGTLLIDTTDHVGAFTPGGTPGFDLTIDSQDTDTDVQKVNLDVRVNVSGGTALLFKDTGVEEAKVDVTVENSAYLNTYVDDLVTGGTEGELKLSVVDGAIDTIKILDTSSAGSFEGTNGFDGDDFDLFVTVSDDWANASNPLTIDASAIADTDADDDTGGGLFDLTAETDALLTVTGTQNDDVFSGSALGDKIFGEGGDDLVFGKLGNDVIDGGAGDDTLWGEEGDDTILGGDGDDNIIGGLGKDTLTGGAGADQFLYNDPSKSNGDIVDTITDFETGSDEVEILVDESGTSVNDVWNLGSFASVGTSGEGDNSLQGSVGNEIRGDYYYSSVSDQLVIDIDGNGDVTAPADYVIGSPNTVAAGDVNFTIELGGGDDVIRLGQGEDDITADDGDDNAVDAGSTDKYVIVGAITQAQANVYATTPDPIGDADVAKVVSKAELGQVRTVSEANDGDEINAYGDADELHIFGDVNLSLVDVNLGVFTDDDVETLIVHSTVTLTDEQFENFGNVKFTGEGDHELTIISSVDGHVLNVAEVTALLADNSPVIDVDGTGDVTINGTPIEALLADEGFDLGVTFDDPTPGFINETESTAASFTVVGIDADATEVTVTVKDSAANTATGLANLATGVAVIDLSGLVDGALTVDVVQTDGINTTAAIPGGNSGTLDTTTDADTNLTAVPSDLQINKTEALLADQTVNVGGLDGDITEVSVTLIDEANNKVTTTVVGPTIPAQIVGSLVVEGLTDGNIDISVNLKDAAGNSQDHFFDNAAKLDTTVDAAPAIAAVIEDGADNFINIAEEPGLQVTITGLDPDIFAVGSGVKAGATVTAYLEDQSGDQVTLTYSGSGNLWDAGSLAGLTSGDAIDVIVEVTDPFGNSNGFSPYVLSNSTTLDLVAPTIVNPIEYGNKSDADGAGGTFVDSALVTNSDPIQITFNENIVLANASGVVLFSIAGGAPVDSSLYTVSVVGGTTLTITPDVGFDLTESGAGAGVDYFIDIAPGAITDVAGNSAGSFGPGQLTWDALQV